LKRKILIVLLILIPILTVTLIYIINTQNIPIFGENSGDDLKTTEAESTPDIISVTPTPIAPPTISELLTELESGVQSVDEERLFLLTEEESAIGYYSNLILADRCDSEDKDGARYYRAALELYYTREVHFRFASHLLRSGKTEEAENEYLKLLPDDMAFQAIEEFKTEPERISEALINKKEWKAVEKFLSSLVENATGGNTDIVLVKHYAQALAEQSDLKRAIPFYKQLYEQEPENPGIAWWYARCLESAGQATTAANIYSTLGEKGAYQYGIILQNKGRTIEAAEVLCSSNEATSLWRGARIWDTAGMTEKAIETYTRIAEMESSYKDDAAYRAYVLSNRIDKINSNIPEDVLSMHPAWMVRIGKEPVMPKIDEVVYDRPNYLKQAALYEKDGYLDAAAIEIAIGSKEIDLEEKLALGDWYRKREEYYNAILWGIRSISDKPTRQGYELAYPQAFEELVIAASQKYNLEPALLWAIIREESHFRHDAVSWVGALGLMQIMPPTGKDIAARLGVSIAEDDLLKPEINIEFGAFYANSMLKMFGKDMDKAMAAYNGGAGNVKKWTESRFGTLEEDFPTAITFPETQEYITKVMNSYHIYKWLYE